jgi:hypothetical protein
MVLVAFFMTKSFLSAGFALRSARNASAALRERRRLPFHDSA